MRLSIRWQIPSIKLQRLAQLRNPRKPLCNHLDQICNQIEVNSPPAAGEWSLHGRSALTPWGQRRGAEELTGVTRNGSRRMRESWIPRPYHRPGLGVRIKSQ
ncbi:uncharacterized protein LOC144288602 [Canis aureus]